MYQFKDQRKLGEKKHLVFRPTFARIEGGAVLFWDSTAGQDYRSFAEMSEDRIETEPEKMYADLRNKGHKFANRGVGVAIKLTHRKKDYLVAIATEECLSIITGYHGNGINQKPEREEIPRDIEVADSSLRTSAVEALEELVLVKDDKVLRGSVKVTKESREISFLPFDSFPYSPKVCYGITPAEERHPFLTNLHPFPVFKDSAKDSNYLGRNIGVFFDHFYNCFQIVSSLSMKLDDFDFALHTEDQYRDKEGMDTFLYKDKIRFIKLDEQGRLLDEVYRTEANKPKRVKGDFLVARSLVPIDPKTMTVCAKALPLKEVAELQQL